MNYHKLLIANRGEIACRIIRSARDMGISCVVVYVEADSNAPFVQMADEAVKLSDSYLNSKEIIQAALSSGAQAIHPGYGFLAENAEFSRICQDNGFVFIGPTAEIINAMGNKSEAKKIMKSCGVPVIPGSNDVLNDVGEARNLAEKVGYPVMIKASAGGGGRGIRLVKSQDELESAFGSAQAEAKNAFNNGDLYLEKFVENPRHIEVQILADSSGNTVHLGERECTIQRRHQKLIEESPSVIVDSDLRKKLGTSAINAAKTVKYVGVGTVEFLVDKNLNYYFMEMNTRIQVEHPVTEMVSGVDLIKQQIRMHVGKSFPSFLEKFQLRGHAIECRINAEDPANDFVPSPMEITSFHMPGGKGVRVDSHAYAGYKIPTYYDSMIGKLIVFSSSRERAIIRMERALEECIIEGPKTTIPFHQAIMRDEQFISGNFDTSFLDNFHYSVAD